MSLEAFDIDFDHPSATYYNGQSVTGRIYIHLSAPKKVGGLYVKCTGESSVTWVQKRETNRNGRNRNVTGHYNSQETYFENTNYLLGGPTGEINVPDGEHVYPFSFQLPGKIPSSFEGEFGHVRYTVKATISRPRKFDHDCKAAFTVINPLDLNWESVQSSLKISVSRASGPMCCRSRPISLAVSMSAIGFVSGQRVPALVEVDNPTDKTVTLKCSLIQKVKYTAYSEGTTQTRETTNIVGQHHMKTVERYNSHTGRPEMRIEALPASYLRNCNNIDISYTLEFVASPRGEQSYLRIPVPVVIGTIPLRTMFSALVAQPRHMPDARVRSAKVEGPAQSEESSASVDPFQEYPNMAHPSYEECTTTKANIRSADDSEYLRGVMEFAPRYPTYSFKPPN